MLQGVLLTCVECVQVVQMKKSPALAMVTSSAKVPPLEPEIQILGILI